MAFFFFLFFFFLLIVLSVGKVIRGSGNEAMLFQLLAGDLCKFVQCSSYTCQNEASSV